MYLAWCLHRLFYLSLRKALSRQELFTLFLLFKKLAHRGQSWGGILFLKARFFLLPSPTSKYFAWNCLVICLFFLVTWLVALYSWYLLCLLQICHLSELLIPFPPVDCEVLVDRTLLFLFFGFPGLPTVPGAW